MMNKLPLFLSLFVCICAMAPLSADASNTFDQTMLRPIDQDFSFSIKPNPSRNYLNVIIENGTAGDYQIEVYDVLGKLVLKQSLFKLHTSISVASWKAGVYLVKISNDQQTQTKRFLKQ
ncbi:MAG TPA: hypothetical protein DDY13_04155 [Cytophagales bacterium]|jgi:hypothetical protein|nr:hypothetical protein [Cytophagales bacterium]